MISNLLSIFLLLFLHLSVTAYAEPNYAFPLYTVIWSNSDVPVCWEEVIDDEFNNIMRAYTEEILNQSWEVHSLPIRLPANILQGDPTCRCRAILTQGSHRIGKQPDRQGSFIS